MGAPRAGLGLESGVAPTQDPWPSLDSRVSSRQQFSFTHHGPPEDAAFVTEMVSPTAQAAGKTEGGDKGRPSLGSGVV